MKERACSLSSFSTYLNQGFDLRRQARQMADGRTDPEISPASVFLALFHAFVFRLPSLQALDRELSDSYLQNWIGAERPFRDDTLRYSLCSFHLEPLEQMLVDTNRRLKRGKALDAGRVQGRLVAALDGIEVLSSFSRCCKNCLERQVTGKTDPGPAQPQVQYYHRAVGCQIVSGPLKPFLAVEWLRPGEGEDTAALRLLTRLPALYGSRFFDILLLDSLYAQAPVLKLTQRLGWDVVITLKQAKRDLYQDARGLFQARGPDQTFTEALPGKTYDVRLWEAFGLPFTHEHPQPMRVVRTQEEVTETHYRGEQKQTETTSHEWVWISTLPAPAFSAALVRQLGHLRWKLENNGWMDLTRYWAFKHGFLHACRHRPRRRLPSGERQLVPNQGLAAVTLVLLIAFALCAAFVLRHSKLVRRYRLTALAVAAQLRSSISKAPPSTRAPTQSTAGCNLR